MIRAISQTRLPSDDARRIFLQGAAPQGATPCRLASLHVYLPFRLLSYRESTSAPGPASRRVSLHDVGLDRYIMGSIAVFAHSAWGYPVLDPSGSTAKGRWRRFTRRLTPAGLGYRAKSQARHAAYVPTLVAIPAAVAYANGISLGENRNDSVPSKCAALTSSSQGLLDSSDSIPATALRSANSTTAGCPQFRALGYTIPSSGLVSCS